MFSMLMRKQNNIIYICSLTNNPNIDADDLAYKE